MNSVLNRVVAFACVSFVCHASLTLASDVAPWVSGRLKPSWSDATPLRSVRIAYDAAAGETRNGERLAQAIGRLEPGDRLEIAPGKYSIAKKFNLDLQGTAEYPIWIVGAGSEGPVVITRPDHQQNVLNLGENQLTEYVCLRNLELTGGSTLIRFYRCRHLWLDHCHLHHSGAEGITTNSRDTSHFFITGNHFHHFQSPNATGEAMYLGGNHSVAKMTYSVIANNHVHDCGGKQGDGIELKQGSHHNWIVGNHVHDTQYPCIIVYGTDGEGINQVERNFCYRSGDNVMQVQGEAIVKNNILLSANGAGLSSADHQGKTSDLQVIHNTIVSQQRGVNLTSWNQRRGMIFANNAIYTDGGEAIRFPGGSEGVEIAGNVVVGRVSGVSRGFSLGEGLEDFIDLTWDSAKRDVRPSATSPLLKAGVSQHSVEADFLGAKRNGVPTSGAISEAGP